jgi:hypothetical protein
MGTSVQIIEKYYGKQATPLALATMLGGWKLWKAQPEWRKIVIMIWMTKLGLSHLVVIL